MSRRCLRVVVQSGQRQGRRRALVDDRPENIVDCLAQFSGPKQSLLRTLGIGIAPLVKPVHLGRFQHTCVFAEACEIRVSFEQLLGLDVTIVEGVDEVEADIARNQIEARRSAAGDCAIIFRLRQKFLSVSLSNH